MNKQLLTIADRKEYNEQEGAIVAWASRPIVDRTNEIIDPGAWDLADYRKNPVLMLSHDYNKLPVGKVMWVKDTSEGLKFKARFANTLTAQEVKELYKDEIMTSFSVGFKPIHFKKENVKGEDGITKSITRYTKCKLLEISCVSIPCCPDAVIDNNIQSKELRDTVQFCKSHTYDNEGQVIEIIVKNPELEAAIDAVNKIVETAEDKEEATQFDSEVQKDAAAIEINPIEKPYPTEHACRLNEPEQYKKFARKNGEQEHDGKPVDVIYGITEDGKTEIQALRLPKDKWDADAAASFCKLRKGKFEAAAKEKTAEEDIKEKAAALIAAATSGKMMSQEGNPSINDIMNKINLALNNYDQPVEVGASVSFVRVVPPQLVQEDINYAYIDNLYPADYPAGGEVVLYYQMADGSCRYFEFEYLINGEQAVLGGPQEVGQQYVPKGLGAVEKISEGIVDTVEKEGRMLSGKNRKLIQDTVTQMGEALTALNELLDATATLPVPGEGFIPPTKEKDNTVEVIKSEDAVLEMVDGAVLEIDKEETVVLTDVPIEAVKKEAAVEPELITIEAPVEKAVAAQPAEAKQDTTTIIIKDMVSAVAELISGDMMKGIADKIVEEQVKMCIAKMQGKVVYKD